MRITICGDLSISETSAPAFEAGDVAAAFGRVTDVFAKSDRILVNLECALTDSEHKIIKKGPNLKGPKSVAATLKKAGVTDCMLSNNHIFDFGVEGLVDTLEQLNAAGLAWTGVGNDYDDSRRDHTMIIDGITVTVVNVCEHEYTYATENRCGARPFDEFETMDDIRKAKASADYVIVIYHGGKEHCRYPSPRLLKACREMVRCGADVVLCQHSHIIGCYEKFEGAHILYGQGNFHFSKYIDTPGWTEGLITNLTIDRDGIDIDFEPVIIHETGIDLTDDETKVRILKELWERSETIKNGEWKKGWQEFCKTVEMQYKKSVCGHSVEDDLDKMQIFPHYLDCEAHTDVWREIFPTWNKTNELAENRKIH